MTEHLTSQQVTDWRSGVSDAEEILRLDDHMSECAECRSLVAGMEAEHVGAAVRMLRMEFASPHLTEAQLDDYAEHRLQPADLIQHLDRCTECRTDADDLRRFVDANRLNSATLEPAKGAGKAPVSTRQATPVWLRPLAAGVAITALGLSAWFALQKQRAGSPDQPSTKQAPAEVAFNIPAPYLDEVKAAMNSGVLHIPSSVASMTTGPVQLRSTEVKESAFHLISPLATAVVEDTPSFQWTPVEGATYGVSVYDDQFREVASGKSIKGTEWRPEKPLARGAIYRWEVRAVKGSHVDKAPTPTKPEAMFQVLPSSESRRLADARTAMPNAPLALGILFADSGALDDARRELSSAAASGTAEQKSTAEKLLEQLK